MRKTLIGLAIGGGALFALIAVAVLSGYVPGTSWHSKRLGRSVVGAQLKDPFSAHFEDTTVGRFTGGPLKGREAFCGKVNAKNSNGAYAGFQQFIAATGSPYVRFQPLDTPPQEEVDRLNLECEGAKIRAKYDSFASYEIGPACEASLDAMKQLKASLEFRRDYLATCVIK